MELQQNMASVMRTLKEKSGKSMTEFSKELEISRSALQEYLSGNGNPNMTTVEHLANKLGVTPSLLVSGCFANEQLEVLMKLLDVLGIISELDYDKRIKFSQLLLDMVLLWNEGDSNG